jgi:4-methyl-5(b-hydroxyethyl)-thiazole monophosphate biosynthesis
MSKALIILAEGFEEVEAVTAVDVLRRGDVEVVIAALGNSLSVKGAHGIEIAADAYLESVKNDTYEAVVLPGGGLGTENLMASSTVKTLLQTQKESNRLICAICAAPLVLVEAGVLDVHHHITCYPSCAREIERKTVNVPVVADGNIITGQGPGASLLFALVVLQSIKGQSVAKSIANQMVTDVMK